MIDLGAWANETYRVQAIDPDEEEEFSPDRTKTAGSNLRDD